MTPLTQKARLSNVTKRGCMRYINNVFRNAFKVRRLEPALSNSLILVEEGAI